MLYVLTSEDVEALSNLLRERMIDNARKTGIYELNAVGESVAQMVKYHIPRLAHARTEEE